jgi:uncharacterized protein
VIPRILTQELLVLLEEYPVVTLLGPRQAGKTTLVREILDGYKYVNLELPNTLQVAREDPVAFLRRHPGKVIFDEIQRAPQLLSYLQGIVDENQTNGQFVLTGSHQLELRAAITQSLAGRTGIVHLLPFSIEELDAAGIKYDAFEEYIFRGFLPRIYDQNQKRRFSGTPTIRIAITSRIRSIYRIPDRGCPELSRFWTGPFDCTDTFDIGTEFIEFGAVKQGAWGVPESITLALMTLGMAGLRKAKTRQ